MLQDIAMEISKRINSKDQVFRQKWDKVNPFVFDENVANCFDDMVKRSIPFYNEIHGIIIDIIERNFKNKGAVYDLGCSTGSTIEILIQYFLKHNLNPSIIGVDNSKSMLIKSEEKLTPYNYPHLTLDYNDVSEISFNPSELIIMNYTLQFIPKHERLELLHKIYKTLLPGGLFILAEKIYSKTPEINQFLIDLYYDFKRRNEYSELEISQKREALENVLMPLTPEEQITQLKSSGFKKSEMIFRWYNFALYIGIK